MTPDLAALLVQDGLTSGAIYSLLGLTLVLVFSVTRVIFIPQGEFVAYGALTLSALVAGKFPPTAAVLAAAGAASFVADAFDPNVRRLARWLPRSLGLNVVAPLLVVAVVWWSTGTHVPLVMKLLCTVATVGLMGPFVYRLVYQPAPDASVLALLILSVALHFVMLGVGLAMFGPEGVRTPSLVEGVSRIGSVDVAWQTLLTVLCVGSSMLALLLFFTRTLRGKALRATAVNRRGARIIGISVAASGRSTFLIAAALGALSGGLISASATMYYNSGFLIGLKGFVAAILGGLTSYPLTVGAALAVGVIESFASFFASAFKEVIVFLMVLPFLSWLSLRTAFPVAEEADA